MGSVPVTAFAANNSTSSGLPPARLSQCFRFGPKSSVQGDQEQVAWELDSM
jgi:hypothetical protein